MITIFYMINDAPFIRGVNNNAFGRKWIWDRCEQLIASGISVSIKMED